MLLGRCSWDWCSWDGAPGTVLLGLVLLGRCSWDWCSWDWCSWDWCSWDGAPGIGAPGTVLLGLVLLGLVLLGRCSWDWCSWDGAPGTVLLGLVLLGLVLLGLVLQTGLDLAIKTVKDRLPVIGIAFNDNYLYRDSSRISELRTVERAQFELEDDGLTTLMVFDQRFIAVQDALFSIYTTSFIIVLLVVSKRSHSSSPLPSFPLLSFPFFSFPFLSLPHSLPSCVKQNTFAADYSLYSVSGLYGLCLLLYRAQGGTYFFSSDVTRLVIGPIERLVDLVRKISANPLGVEYKMLGAKEGFYEGMETTVLLTTITKIGGLMRVGFGEAGASVIAKNLAESSGGRLNLMGAGTMIHSIFGFCDVRQFTDTTECLQEEVMLFVNRIAHILHSIVVQCSGSANKNIGDAFLLTWKLDDKLTPEQVSSLADQALLAFVKSLIELSRHQEFICNFSVAATARLYKRFPEYNVRIGCGLHVGWAIEGAIGSNRKIDASYLSPHVNNTEYLESSTKQYGVPLLMSEPFFKLLSPAASRYCRQVDRVRRSELEEPMGLFTYDSDLNINWNDPFRHKNKKMSDTRSRMLAAAKRAKANVSSKKQSGTGESDASAATSGADAGAGAGATSDEAAGTSIAGGAATTSASAAASHSHSSAAAGAAAITRSVSPGGIRPAGRQSVLAPNNPRKPSTTASAASAASTGSAARGRGGRRASAAGLPGGLPDALDTGAATATGTGSRAARAAANEQADEEAAVAAADAAEKAKQAPTIVVKKYEQNVWETDAEVVELRHRVNDSFRALWQDGIAAFIKGDWQKARDIFHETMRTSNNKDGPSKFLMAMIDEHGGTAPHDWPGFRDDF